VSRDLALLTVPFFGENKDYYYYYFFFYSIIFTAAYLSQEQEFKQDKRPQEAESEAIAA
jgi:hypothetical protein